MVMVKLLLWNCGGLAWQGQCALVLLLFRELQLLLMQRESGFSGSLR